MAIRKPVKTRPQAKKTWTSKLSGEFPSSNQLVKDPSHKLLQDASMTKLNGDLDVYIGEIKSVEQSEVGFD